MMSYSVKTILIIAFSVVCLYTTAQERNIIPGAKGGLNMATLQDSKNTKSKAGIVAGITAGFKF